MEAVDRVREAEAEQHPDRHRGEIEVLDDPVLRWRQVVRVERDEEEAGDPDAHVAETVDPRVLEHARERDPARALGALGAPRLGRRFGVGVHSRVAGALETAAARDALPPPRDPRAPPARNTRRAIPDLIRRASGPSQAA